LKESVFTIGQCSIGFVRVRLPPFARRATAAKKAGHYVRLGITVALACGAAAIAVAQQPAQKKWSYPVVRDQRGVIPPGPKVAPYNSPPLGDGPFLFESYEQRKLRVSVVTRGLSHPWSIAFLPGGDILVTERVGRLRLIRNRVLQPNPVPGTPKVVSLGTMAGLMDIALHPRFAENKWINVILPGKNYGWPVVSYGSDYRGPRVATSHGGAAFEEPRLFWTPAIALSGMTFYNGDRFPNWKRNLFVGGMREGEIARTGQLVRIVFNDNWQELRRESLLRDLHQRIRDVRQGPDGLLYVITDEDAAALLQIEPTE
jgi:glucose/arabinose dehydrogenase